MKRRIGIVFEGCDGGGCDGDDDNSIKSNGIAEKIAVLVPSEISTIKDLKHFIVPKTSEKNESWSIYQKRFAKEFMKTKKKEEGCEKEHKTYKFKSALYFYENGLRILDEDTLDIIGDNDLICCRVTAKPVKTTQQKMAPKSVIKRLEKRREEPPKKKQKPQTSKHHFFDSDGEIVMDDEEGEEEKGEGEEEGRVDKEKEKLVESSKENMNTVNNSEVQTKKKRRRRRKNKKKDDTLVNVSVILDSANPPPPNTPAHKITTSTQEEEPDYTPNDLPESENAAPTNEESWDIVGSESLDGTPEKGDIIGWKELFLNDNFVPEYTDWRVGTVLSVDEETKMVTFEEPTQKQMLLDRMLIPKLIKRGPNHLFPQEKEKCLIDGDASQPQQQEQEQKQEEQEEQKQEKKDQNNVNEKRKKIPSCKGLAATLAQIRKNSNNQ